MTFHQRDALESTVSIYWLISHSPYILILTLCISSWHLIFPWYWNRQNAWSARWQPLAVIAQVSNHSHRGQDSQSASRKISNEIANLFKNRNRHSTEPFIIRLLLPPVNEFSRRLIENKTRVAKCWFYFRHLNVPFNLYFDIPKSISIPVDFICREVLFRTCRWHFVHFLPFRGVKSGFSFYGY